MKKYYIIAETDLKDTPYVFIEDYYIKEGTGNTWSFNIQENDIAVLHHDVGYDHSPVEGEYDRYQLKIIPPENSGIDIIVYEKETVVDGVGGFDNFYFDNTTMDYNDFPVYHKARSDEDMFGIINSTYTLNSMIGTWQVEIFWIGDGEDNLDFGDTISVKIKGAEVSFEIYELDEDDYFPE